MAEGGHAPGGSPIIVGERGPEVFVPSTSGTVLPGSLAAVLGYGDIPRPGHGGPHEWTNDPIPMTEYGYGPTALAERVHPVAWEQWLAGLPLSENIEDRRDTPGYIGYRPVWK
jgi:hypothetical protein